MRLASWRRSDGVVDVEGKDGAEMAVRSTAQSGFDTGSVGFECVSKFLEG